LKLNTLGVLGVSAVIGLDLPDSLSLAVSIFVAESIGW
jgi:hypothetical protein